MNLLTTSDIEYPFAVTVIRPQNTFSEDGNYTENLDTIIEGMTADIQLSLKIRNLMAEDETGTSDKTEWVMYCTPPVAIQAGDRVTDGSRAFTVEAVADWGSHTECVMRKVAR